MIVGSVFATLTGRTLARLSLLRATRLTAGGTPVVGIDTSGPLQPSLGSIGLGTAGDLGLGPTTI